MTDDLHGRGLLPFGGRLPHKRKQSTLDVSMEPPKSAGFFWNRKKHITLGNKNKRPRGGKVTPGTHEAFLEHEGFLSPEDPDMALRPVRPYENRIWHTNDAKTSEDSAYASSASFNGLRQGSPNFGGKNHESRPQLFDPAKRHKKSILSFSRSSNEDPLVHTRFDGSRQSQMPDGRRDGRTTTSFLRRCMSLRSQGRPQTPSTPISTHYDSSPASTNLAAPVPDFGLVPGSGYEPSRSPANLSSGAAARAAAAAQNEILATMRSLSLTDPKLNRDSESGVGIEVRDRTSDPLEWEVPIVRQNPVNLLPIEIMTHVLSFLDAPSLVQAELVSHEWYQIASSRHAWKQVYHSEVNELSHGSLAVQDRRPPGQDWKSMWKTRKALNQRWLDGHAAAIYLEGHTDSVYCVQFDKDKIVTGSRDRTVRIWDARTYECIQILGVPAPTRTNTMPPLPDPNPGFGRRPVVKLFSPPVSTPTLTRRMAYSHSGSILCLQYDNDIMVTGSSDWSLIVWDVKAHYQPFRKLRGHGQGVLDVCFDHKYIVSCSKDTTVKLWDRLTGQLLRTLSGHRGPVNAVQLRGNLVVSASGDGIAKLWNLNSGLCIKEFPSKDRGMACVEFSPDSRTILAGGNDQVIYQFDTNSGELVRELKGHEGLVRSLHLDSTSGRVVSGSYDTSVKAFDLKTGQLVVNFTKWTSSWILSAKADYRRIIATSQDSRAVIMDFGYQLPGMEALEL